MPLGSSITVNIQGLERLEKALNSLPEKIAKRVLVGAVRRGIKPIQDAAQTNAPYLTGKLERGIVTRLTIKSDGVKGASVKITLGLKTGSRDKKSPSVFYGRFLEKGTKFIRPQPFMKPAFDTWVIMALKETADALQKGIEQVAKS